MRIHTSHRLVTLTAFMAVLAWSALCSLQATPAESTAGVPDSVLLSHTLQGATADVAWAELTNTSHATPTPESWKTSPPSVEEKIKYFTPYISALIDKAKSFYTHFPSDKRALDAKLMAFQLSEVTQQWGQTNQQPQFLAVGNLLLKDPALAGHDHYVILWKMAQHAPAETARPLLEEIAKGDAPEQLKAAAADLVKKMEMLGKPVTLQFTAVDGRAVDTSKLKGKVVLLDFWATWCPPCVGEVPNVKKAYDQFHSKGFEVVGISLDEDKDKLTQFVSSHAMAWPQYFDGLHWQNKYARQFGISAIPAMWLIDKKGALRNTDAREDLGGEIQKLLTE